MIPWFPLFLVCAVGMVALIIGVARWVSCGLIDGERPVIGGMVLVAIAILCALWNAGYMLGYIAGWWS